MEEGVVKSKIRVVYYEFHYCNTSSRFKLYSVVPNSILSHCCDCRINFLSVIDLISASDYKKC